MKSTFDPRRAAKKPAVICLHSSAGSGAQWKTLADMLRGEFEVLTPDLYGHGNGPAWDGGSEGVVVADTVRIACLAAQLAPVHLVGHSYGGAIALRVALHHPGTVASVAVYEPVAMRVLFDYNSRSRAAAEVVDVARTVRREVRNGSVERAAQRFIDYWAGAAQWTALAPERQASIARSMRVIADQFVALERDTVGLADYRRLDTPILYLSGERTRASTRRISELLRFAMPHVDTSVMRGLGHLGPITHPLVVAQSITAFVRAQHMDPALERKAA
jgi:pimeloyl-ACP methyl ester carboxylesterase